MTQLGRIEYALKGGRIDTDSIDNSAGVDTSDREVNIKIAIDALIHAGKLDPALRHKVLHGLTDEVAALVLADNDAQGQALTLAETAKRERFEADVRLMRDLERRKQLDRAVDFLPDDETVAARAKSGAFLTRPELCVLLSLAKNALVDALMDTDYPDGPRRRGRALTPPFRRASSATIAPGSTCTGCGARSSPPSPPTSWSIAAASPSPTSRWRKAAAMPATSRAPLPSRAARSASTRSGTRCARSTTRSPPRRRPRCCMPGGASLRVATGWLLRRRAKLDVAADIASYRPGVASLAERSPEIVGIDEFNAARDALCAKGVPEPIAVAVTRLDLLDPALAIVELGGDPVAAARQFAAAGATLKLGRMVAKLRALVGSGLWQQRAAESLIEELYRGQAAITRLAGRRHRRVPRASPPRRRSFPRHRRRDRHRTGPRPRPLAAGKPGVGGAGEQLTRRQNRDDKPGGVLDEAIGP